MPSLDKHFSNIIPFNGFWSLKNEKKPTIFGSVGSMLLPGLFSSCSEWGPPPSCSARSSHCGGLSCCRAQALGHTGFSSCSMWAQKLGLTGLGTPRHVWSSWNRDWTHVSCIGRQVLCHWATRDAPQNEIYIQTISSKKYLINITSIPGHDSHLFYQN